MRQILIAVFILSISACYADWNEDFDNQTALVVKEFPPLQNSSYKRTYKEFQKIREKLLTNRKLVDQIRNWGLEDKLRVIQKGLGVILKKRRNHHLHDFYLWELSYLTGSNNYILPAFPIEIGEKIVIVQPLENFEVGTILGGNSKKSTEKVSLETYWKALLQAYILGLSDLVSTNIGINEKGIIRFFDNEACLIYRNAPFRNNFSFKMGFQCQAIDWPQYNQPLDGKTAKRVQAFVNSFASSFEENARRYLSLRDVTVCEDGMEIRIAHLMNFSYNEGVTFHDFYSYLYPKMSSGFDDLSNIVSNILNMKARHGLSLFFVTRGMKKYNLTNKEKNAIEQWVKTYVD